MTHDHSEDEHGYTQAHQLADEPHGAHHPGGHAEVALIHRAHDGVGVWRREERKPQAHEDQAYEYGLKRCPGRKQCEERESHHAQAHAHGGDDPGLHSI